VLSWHRTGTGELSTLLAMQCCDSLLWLIDTVPLLLAAVAGLAGWRHDRLAALIDGLDDTIAQQTSELRHALAAAEATPVRTSIRRLVARTRYASCCPRTMSSTRRC
jgi:hypothetical protein